MEDKKQLEAINLDKGSALILAGPGSGKTHVLTHHIKFLIGSKVPPENILVITFTRRAAREMKDRFSKLLPYAANRVVFGTFHSVFIRILKIFQKDIPNIITEEKRNEIIGNITGDSDKRDYYESRFSLYKSVENKDDFKFESETEKEEFFNYFNQYEEILNQMLLMDFDDILVRCKTLLETDSKALDYLRNQFKYICVDEFQDINDIQYSVLKLLGKGSSVFFCVGDEDQSIYGFRGSNPELMKRFKEEFGARVINLNANYRSYEDIINYSYRVISKNRGRLRDEIQTALRKSDDRHVFIKVSKEKGDSFELLREDINKNLSEGRKCAVLFRTNKEVVEFTKLFADRKEEEVSTLINREITQDYIRYAQYCISRNTESLRGIVNHPQRYIPLSLITTRESIEELALRFTGTRKGDSLYIFSRQLSLMEKLNSFSFAMYLRNVCGLQDYYVEKYSAKHKPQIEVVFEKIVECSKKCNDLKTFEECLVSMNNTSVSVKKTERIENLFVTTFHQSKGLEFECVFLPDVVEGKIPSGLSVAGCSVDEERRLFYVAMTRAKDYLYIYTIKNEESGGMLPSRFIDEFIY